MLIPLSSVIKFVTLVPHHLRRREAFVASGILSRAGRHRMRFRGAVSPGCCCCPPSLASGHIPSTAGASLLLGLPRCKPHQPPQTSKGNVWLGLYVFWGVYSGRRQWLLSTYVHRSQERNEARCGLLSHLTAPQARSPAGLYVGQGLPRAAEPGCGGPGAVPLHRWAPEAGRCRGWPALVLQLAAAARPVPAQWVDGPPCAGQ